MWLMLQQDQPDDYSDRNRRRNYSVRDFLGSPLFHIKGLDWRKYVETDSSVISAAEVDDA